MKTYLSIPFAGRNMVACIHYNDQVDPMEILVRDQGFEVTAFRQLPDRRWLFNPESLPICPKMYDPTDIKLFVLDLKILRHILTHEPFSFPLDSCRKSNTECNGHCCNQPPSLHHSEVDYFMQVYDQECLDFSGLFTYLQRSDDHCYFFDSQSMTCKLHSNGKPRVCQWHYCDFKEKIVNPDDMSAYIRYILSPEPSSQSMVRHQLVKSSYC